MWKNHPKGLVVLFFTEMWERFGYYTMLAILALYMDEHFHLNKQVSGNIYGIFIAFVYFSPLLGGFLADKVFGYKKAILIGATLMAVGYTTLGINNINMFYMALVIIVLGNGFFNQTSRRCSATCIATTTRTRTPA
jgi:POT family proton-dependent oligopeptide transporter